MTPDVVNDKDILYDATLMHHAYGSRNISVTLERTYLEQSTTRVSTHAHHYPFLMHQLRAMSPMAVPKREVKLSTTD